MNGVLNQLVCTNPNICTTVIDDELVVMNIENNAYYKMNGCARFIWEKIFAKPCTIQNLISSVAEYYQISITQVEVDMNAFIDSMTLKNLIQVIE